MRTWSRRGFIKAGLALGGMSFAGFLFFRQWEKVIDLFRPALRNGAKGTVFIGKVQSYEADITAIILSGLKEMKITRDIIKNKRIVLKPNLVETFPGANHINTHPLVVRGAIEAFLKLGAEAVFVAEAPGHCRDSLLVLEESGLGEILYENKIPFIDMNYGPFYTVPNTSRISRLPTLTFPDLLRRVDWVVSIAKMKTHHWAGVTLSMKNLFGVMPGIIYGWPKNVLHWAGINQCIIDINTSLRPQFAIVDGIVGMEGDGPIMGDPKYAGTIVMGRDLAAVDATCARIMGILPERIGYLLAASFGLGTIEESEIIQQGERIDSVQTDFALLNDIPSQRRLRQS